MRVLPKTLFILGFLLLFVSLGAAVFLLISFSVIQNPFSHKEMAEPRPDFLSLAGERTPNLLPYFLAVQHLITHTAGLDAAREAEAASDNTRSRGGYLHAVYAMDLFSSGEAYMERAGRQLHELFNDSGFSGYLQTLGLTLSREPYEDDYFVFFDFLTLNGRRTGSLGIQKRLGRVYLFDDEYISLGAIETFGLRNTIVSERERFNTDVLPLGPYEGGRNHVVLLVGTDQRMADTLILAIADEEKQNVDLFSLPRDLFYKDLKINEIMHRFGAAHLLREIENITGFSIDNYIIIDMYAFIDVIDILGGIEITLNSPLVDPTYRVRDDGVWSTLFYPAGTHQLSGIETLRIARSRHFVSDFGRAQHQQLILAALVDNFTSLGLSDIGRIYELAVVLIRYVETDFTPYSLFRNFLRFRNAEVRSQTVFSTHNILYSTYLNLWRHQHELDELDEDFFPGQYILLPLNDDWSLIHRYIRYIIEDPTEEYLEEIDEDIAD